MLLQGADRPATNTADSALQPTGIVDDSGFKKRRTKSGLVDHDATVPTANALVVYGCDQAIGKWVGIVLDSK